jgi:hypothetical protein
MGSLLPDTYGASSARSGPRSFSIRAQILGVTVSARPLLRCDRPEVIRAAGLLNCVVRADDEPLTFDRWDPTDLAIAASDIGKNLVSAVLVIWQHAEYSGGRSITTRTADARTHLETNPLIRIHFSARRRRVG